MNSISKESMIKLGRGVAVNRVISIFWREQDAPAVFLLSDACMLGKMI